MSVPAPNPAECQGLLFKALCRLRVFPSQPDHFKSSANLVAAAPFYGLIFVGTPNGFQVLLSIKIAEIQAPRGETLEYPHRNINLGCSPSHLSVSCDQSQLAVAFVKDGCPSALIYDVASLCSRDLKISLSIRLASSPGSKVLDLQFNPGLPQFLAACTSDGGVGVYELKEGSFLVSTLNPATHPTCLCWSPKGKQLVVGDSKGHISQYKPDLKLVKSYPPPPDKPASAIVNLLWISNCQFAAVYADTANPSERPGIMIVNVPKTGTSYINYEDICYSAGELRSPQFYMVQLAKWNLMMVASANSMEVGVLALASDGVTWLQWTQEDAARAELPLTPLKQETYPVGLAIDTSSTYQIAMGENQSLPPMPMLHILSHDGVLCVFHVINILPEVPCICEPPKPLPDMSGLDQFVVRPPLQQMQTSIPAQPLQEPLPSVTQPTSQTQLFQPPPSHPTQSSQLSSSLLQSAQSQPPVPVSAPNPLQQLSSMSNQLQQMSQPAKPSGFGSLGMVGLGIGAPQSQSGFSLSSSTAPAAQSSTFGFSQSIASGASISKTATGAFNVPSLQSPQPSTPPPSYSVPTTMTTAPQVVTPEVSQRPSIVVPVAPVQSSQTTNATQHAKEIEPANVESSEDKAETVDPAIYAELIQEEIKVFNNELSKLKQLVTQELPRIGSEEDKKTLIKTSQELESFITELSKSVKDLKHDVFEVKTVGSEALFWVEDAKSRLRQFSEPSYLQLIKAQELDPVSARTLFNIQQRFSYVEIQLGNINKQLNLEWGQYQDTRSPRNRMFVPSMDEVYQTMVKQTSIMNKLKIILEDVSQRIAARKHKSSNRIPLISDSALARKPASRRLQLHENDSSFRSETDLSCLAENLLESQLKKQQSDDSDLEALASRTLNLNIKKSPVALAAHKGLNSKKEDKLREILLQIPMTRIKANRTPSELGSMGNRPCVSFSSSVLSLSPRKPISAKEAAGSVLSKQISSSSPSSQSATPSSSSLSKSTPQPAAAFPPSGLGLFSQKSKPSIFNASTSISTPALPVAFSAQTKASAAEAPKAVTSTPASLFAGSSIKQTPAPPPSPSPFASSTFPPVQAPASSTSGFKFSAVLEDTPSSKEPAPVASNLKSTPVITFGQTTSSTNQPSSFVNPSPSISVGSVAPKAPQSFSTPKGSDSLSALNDMVNKAGPAVTSTSKPFAAPPAQAKTTAASSFSFSTVSKPATVPASSQPSAPSKSADGASPPVVSPKTPIASSSPVIVVGAAPSSSASAGLLPTPSVTTAQSFYGGALTIKPITVTSSTAAAAAASTSTPAISAPSTAAADSTTPFFGGMSLGGAPSATNKPAAAIFGGAGSSFQAGKPSLFGEAPVDFSTSSVAASTASLFAAPSSTATSAPASGSAFGFGSLASSLTPQTSTAVTSAAAAANPPPPPATTATATTTSLLGQPPSSFPATRSLLAAPGTSTTTSLFDQSASATSTTPALGQSLFATPPASGAAATPALAAAAAAASQVVAAAAATAGPAASGAVGSGGSIFGGGTGLLFGGATPAVSAAGSTGSIFAGAAGTSPAVFASSGSGTGFSFALPATATATTTTATTWAAAKPFSFALPAAAAAATTTTATTGAAAKPFSFAPPSSSASGSAFGASEPSLFGQAATSVTTTATSPSFFSQPICSPTAPASGGGIFGGGNAATTATQAPLFGQGTTPSAFGTKPSFGQSGGSLFGQSPGFGSAPSATVFGGGSSSSSIFGGGTPTSPSQSGSKLFQQASSGGSVFGQTPASPASGSFSNALGATIEQTGFGTPSAFQNRSSGGFGGFQNTSAGSFGSAPAFGSPPAFGSTPAFGGAPAFGSPSRVFGSTPPTTGFGATSPNQTNSTFEALATQDGPTFGNIAQGGPQSPQPTNVFGGAPAATPFSNTGPSFGGTSFSSWR